MRRIYLFIAFTLVYAFPLYSQEVFDYVKDGSFQKTARWLADNDQIKDSYARESEEGVLHAINIIEWAAFFDQAEIVDLFIENKSKFVYYEEWISKAFAASIHNCNAALTTNLLKEGAKTNVNCGMCNEGSPLAIALSYKCMDLYKLLRLRGLPLYSSQAGYDVIHSAAGHPDSLLLKDLVEHEKLDVNQKGTASPYYPIFFAVMDGQNQNIKYLRSKGARLDVKEENGLTILNYANSLETFKLLEEWANTTNHFTIEESNKAYPLIMGIVMSDNPALFDYFVEKYPNLIRTRDKEGRNAMFSLLETTENTEYFFSVLKKKGVSCTLSDKNGKDLKYYAKKMKNKVVLSLLKS